MNVDLAVEHSFYFLHPWWDTVSMSAVYACIDELRH